MSREPLSFWNTVWAVAFGQILAGVLLIAVSFLFFFGVLALGCAAAMPGLSDAAGTEIQEGMSEEEIDRRLDRLIREYGGR